MLGVKTRILAAGLRLRAAGSSKAPAKAKKSKGDGAPAPPPVSKEIREKFVVGANFLKEGSDPPLKDDSEYPDWLWTLLDKQPPLSELSRKKVEELALPELQRLVKLDNRAKIKEKNSIRSKS
eukprot:TRINITY_DN29371_c0_g1_i1.p1 TRINITY_DN29371_c0_g1~~TRINITY_DN29371_c0_g1_i1.p1  ORF type:complete len:123 (-),score=29.00 TRINITY_DN29371_c0_g1_i1:229-597(-)